MSKENYWQEKLVEEEFWTSPGKSSWRIQCYRDYKIVEVYQVSSKQITVKLENQEIKGKEQVLIDRFKYVWWINVREKACRVWNWRWLKRQD